MQYSTVFSVARQPLVVEYRVGDLPGDYPPSRPNPALVLYLHFPTVHCPTTKDQQNYHLPYLLLIKMMIFKESALTPILS